MATDSTIKILIQAIDEASKDIERVKGKLKELEKQTEDSSTGFDSYGEAFNALAGNIAKTAVPLVAAVAAVGTAAYKLGESGAQFMRMEDASGQLAISMGADMGEIVRAIQEASFGTVSEFDIMQAASRAMLLGVSADAGELADLMQVAEIRGRAMGISTTQAFNDIVTGIGRNSPLILDNLGIVIDSEQAYLDYATSIGKAADELTEAEKKQAILNSVLETGGQMIEEAGGLALDAAGNYERLGASFENAFNIIKKNTAEALDPLIKKTADAFDVMVLLDKAVEQGAVTQQDAMRIAMDFRGNQQDMTGVIEFLTDAINTNGAAFYANTEIQSDYVKSLVTSEESAVVLTDATEDETEAFEQLKFTTEEAAAALESVRKAAADAAVDFKDLAAALLGLDAAGAAKQQIEQLDQLLDDGKITAQDYAAAVREIQIRAGFATEASYAMASGVEMLNGMVAAGVLDANDYSSAWDIANGVASDGTITWGELEQALVDAGLTTQEQVDAMNGIDLGEATAEAQGLRSELDGITNTPGYQKKTIEIVTIKKLVETYESIGKEGLGGFFAEGGPVSSNTPYIVGEMGPELFIPRSSGTIIPNDQLSRSNGGSAWGGNSSGDINIYIDGEKVLTKSIAKAIKGQGLAI